VARKPALASRTSIAASILALAFALAATSPLYAASALVSGHFTYRDGAPAGNRQLHFENRVSADMFIAATTADGAFSADLPPGVYDLRAERGVVLKPDIIVAGSDIDVGRIVEPAPLDYHRPFQHEGIAEAIVTSAAPATANTHGRPMEGMKYGHETTQKYFEQSQPLPPIPAPEPAIPVAGPSPAAQK
jgi:hypothetical protein